MHGLYSEIVLCVNEDGKRTKNTGDWEWGRTKERCHKYKKKA